MCGSRRGGGVSPPCRRSFACVSARTLLKPESNCSCMKKKLCSTPMSCRKTHAPQPETMPMAKAIANMAVCGSSRSPSPVLCERSPVRARVGRNIWRTIFQSTNQKEMPHTTVSNAMLLTTSPAQGLLFGFAISIPPRADRELADGETLRVGALSLTAMHTPGHSPGHVVFHVPDHELLFCGDLVFAGSVGRTDFPGCDKEAMQASLRRMLALPDATTLLPGHMGTSTVGEEAATNPFLVGLREWAAPRVS